MIFGSLYIDKKADFGFRHLHSYAYNGARFVGCSCPIHSRWLLSDGGLGEGEESQLFERVQRLSKATQGHCPVHLVAGDGGLGFLAVSPAFLFYAEM